MVEVWQVAEMRDEGWKIGAAEKRNVPSGSTRVRDGTGKWWKVV